MDWWLPEVWVGGGKNGQRWSKGKKFSSYKINKSWDVM